MECELIKFGLLHDVASHFDQVINGIAFNTSRSLDQPLVLLGIGLEEEPLTSEP